MLMLNNWTKYLLESSVCLMFFYAFYRLFLQQETFFKTNRRYLQFTMVASLLIPMAESLLVKFDTSPSNIYILETVVITAQRAELQARAALTQTPWLTIGIAITSLFFLSLLIYSIVRVTLILNNSEKIIEGNLTYVINPKIEHPFTFLRYIFIDKKLYDNPKYRHIIEHEKTHALQRHTLDLLISGAITAILWFNPFAWLYREAFREIHEYLADDRVLKQGADPTQYKQLVYNQAIGLWPGSFSFFNVSFIKRRFKMMSRMKSPKSNLLKVFIMIPVTALMIFVFACTTENENIDDAQVVKAPTAAPAVDVPAVDVPDQPEIAESNQADQSETKNSELPYTIVEQMPEYPGGQKELFSYISSNVKYPQEAKEKGISGKVFIQFVVAKTGSIQDVKVLRGVHPLLDQEAIRVIKNMPAWKPGMEKGKTVNVVYNIPIAFKLN